MLPDIVNIDKARAQERPRLSNSILRRVKGHLELIHPRGNECLHHVSNGWTVSFNYVPKLKGVPAEVTIELSHTDEIAAQTVSFTVSNLEQTKEGFVVAAEEKPIRFTSDLEQVKMTIIYGGEKARLAPSPEVSVKDLELLAAIASNPRNVNALENLYMPQDWSIEEYV